MLIESVIPSALPFIVGIKHLSTFWARLNLIKQVSGGVGTSLAFSGLA
jgi:hypothetical protein